MVISDFRVPNVFENTSRLRGIKKLYSQSALVRWFDLSSFRSINTLVAIGNERERAFAGINSTHSSSCRKNLES